MLILNQSVLYRNFLNGYTYYLFIGMALLCFFLMKKRSFYVIKYCTIVIAVLLGSVIFERIWSGGIGLEAWATWSVSILAAACPFVYNPEQFPRQFVRVVVFLAGISLIFFTFQIIKPDLLKSILYQFDSQWTYNIWSNEIMYTTYYYKAYGLFLFSFTERGDAAFRNASIFTEPGIYQMVLNSALIFLLFFKKNLQLTESQQIRDIIIVVLALITCQSTTGYIVMFVTIIVYLIATDNIEPKLKNRITFSICIVCVGLVIDFGIRGSGSILGSIILEKIFSQNGTLDLNTSTGYYRLIMIGICVNAIISNPLGIGSDKLQAMISITGVNAVAGSVFVLAATLGIIPCFFVLGWIFYPIIKNRNNVLIPLLFGFHYFNTTLGQSSTFYPSLLIFTLFYFYEGYKEVLINEDEG